MSPGMWLRVSVAALSRRPRFSLLAILLLGLGIGTVTTLFTFVNATLLRPLAFPGADRLVVLRTVVETTGERLQASYPDFQDWRRGSRSFAAMAAYSPAELTLNHGGRVERVPGEVVSDGYFATLGAEPVLGRFFRAEEVVQGGPRVVVIGAALWRRQFAGDPGVLGRPVRIAGAPFEVVGVAPQGFRGMTGKAEAWVPLTTVELLAPRLVPLRLLEAREVRWHQVVARIAPNVTPAAAGQELRTLGARLAQEYPETNAGRRPLALTAGEEVLGSLPQRLALILGAAGFFLLIACVNLASLLLTRFQERAQELTVRSAFGATPRVIASQLFAEAVLLSAGGGVLALGLTAIAREALVRMLSAELALVEVVLDLRVFVFAFLVSLLTAILFGLTPALKAARVDLVTLLREGSRSVLRGGSRFNLQHVVVVSEVALVLVLMVAAASMLKGLHQLSERDLGFAPDHLLTLKLDLKEAASSPEERRRRSEEAVAAVAALPGVDSAALSSYVFFADGWLSFGLEAEGLDPSADEPVKAYRHAVGEGFLTTLGIPLLLGRSLDYTAASGPGEPAREVLVSRSLAERVWPGGDALGRRIRFETDGPWYTIVGVVTDVRHRSLEEDGSPELDTYVALGSSVPETVGLLIRTRGAGAPDAAEVREAVVRASRGVAVYDVTTMQRRLHRESRQARLTTTLITGFALLALCLTVTGIYGILSAAVEQRRPEIWLRLALGASERSVLRMLIRRGVLLALAGVVAGLAGAVVAGSLLASLVYGIGSFEPWIAGSVTLLLLLLAGLASYLPARRTVRLLALP